MILSYQYFHLGFHLVPCENKTPLKHVVNYSVVTSTDSSHLNILYLVVNQVYFKKETFDSCVFNETHCKYEKTFIRINAKVALINQVSKTIQSTTIGWFEKTSVRSRNHVYVLIFDKRLQKV